MQQALLRTCMLLAAASRLLPSHSLTVQIADQKSARSEGFRRHCLRVVMVITRNYIVLVLHSTVQQPGQA